MAYILVLRSDKTKKCDNQTITTFSGQKKNQFKTTYLIIFVV